MVLEEHKWQEVSVSILTHLYLPSVSSIKLVVKSATLDLPVRRLSLHAWWGGLRSVRVQRGAIYYRAQFMTHLIRRLRVGKSARITSARSMAVSRVAPYTAHVSFFSPSFWKKARYRLLYCLREPLNPRQPIKQTNN